MIGHKDLSAGMSAEFELSGARSTYRLRAKVAGLNEDTVQLNMADGRTIAVPLTALVSIAHVDKPNAEPTQDSRSARVAPTQGELARAMESTLAAAETEPQALERAKLIRLRLKEVQGDVSSALNTRLVKAVLSVAEAVEAQAVERRLR
ncbi:hypothetical protein [Microbacterium elymi]|uniref:Uncharacterized protein n=1 Tax=Microbacterium elymi TaxID=2909587 RepID=A0ABY5NMH1_9MICO|nr:hypothetical protein [Microbacterium elymi]UUT36394.1 hypothetical protein L2X98_26055 [Microbacterium elymi]